MAEPVVSNTRENRALNLIRSAAALLVVLGHVRVLFFQDYSAVPHSAGLAVLYALTGLGGPAVLVFFVMSGYWVGGNALRGLRRGTFTWASYASSRLTRLWLVLIPALLVTLVLDLTGQALFPAADIYARTHLYTAIPAHLDHSVLSFLGTMFFVGNLHVQLFGSDMPLWSLAYEFWYYAMFPAALLAVGYARSTRSRLVAAIVLVLSAAIAGIDVLALFPTWLAGAAVAWKRDQIVVLLERLGRPWLGVLQAGAAVATLLMMIAVRQGPLASVGGKLLLGLVAAVLTATLVKDIRWRGVADRALDWTSRSANFSYSLYAIHMPIVTFLTAVLVPRFAERWTVSPAAVGGFVAIMVGLELVAAVFAAGTEQRTTAVRRWMRGRLLRSETSATSISRSRP